MTPADKSPGDVDHPLAQREGQDAASESTTSHVGGQDTSTDMDATCMYQAAEFDKKERDVAFAVTALEARQVTERQLAKAVKDWTIHGDEPLSAHLLNKELVTTKLRDDLIKRASFLCDAISRKTHVGGRHHRVPRTAGGRRC